MSKPKCSFGEVTALFCAAPLGASWGTAGDPVRTAPATSATAKRNTFLRMGSTFARRAEMRGVADNASTPRLSGGVRISQIGKGRIESPPGYERPQTAFTAGRTGHPRRNARGV